MKLGKPPIVEVSLSFTFQSAPTDPGWEYERAVEFIEQFRADYPELEYTSQHFIDFEARPRRKTKPTATVRREPVAVRAFPPERNRYLLTSQDFLQVHLLRTATNDYGGFSVLKAEALNKFDAYLAHYRPAKLTSFDLRYVDLVRVPTVGGKAALKDYFHVLHEPDEEVFGLTRYLRYGFRSVPPGTEDVLTFDMYNVGPDEPEEAVIPFRMEWSVQGFRGLTWDRAGVEGRLDDAHRVTLRCFRSCFTPAGWALFEPQHAE